MTVLYTFSESHRVSFASVVFFFWDFFCVFVCVAKDNLRVNALLNNRLRGQTVNKEARLSARFFFFCVRHVLTCAFLVLFCYWFKSLLRVKARRFSLEHSF